MIALRFAVLLALLSAATARASCETLLGHPEGPDAWDRLSEIVATIPLDRLRPGSIRLDHRGGTLNVSWEANERGLALESDFVGSAEAERHTLTLAARRIFRWANERAGDRPDTVWTLSWTHRTSVVNDAEAVARGLGFVPWQSFASRTVDRLIVANIAVAAMGLFHDPSTQWVPVGVAAASGLFAFARALGRDLRFDRTYGQPPDDDRE